MEEKKNNKPLFVKMMVLYLLLVLGIGGAMLASTIKTQVIDGEMWREKAKAREELTRIEPARRGTIFSSDGKVLATTVPVCDLCLDLGRWPRKNSRGEQVYVDKDNILQAKLKVKSQHSKAERYIAFSGIGENQKFFDTLKREGLHVVGEVAFEDHVWYDQKNIDILTTKFGELKATKFITTSKDYVKLPEEFRENVEVLEIGYEIPGLEAIFKTS